MTEQPTIKNLKDTLETMRKIYDFKDDETFFYNNFTGEEFYISKQQIKIRE